MCVCMYVCMYVCIIQGANKTVLIVRADTKDDGAEGLFGESLVYDLMDGKDLTIGA